MKKIGTPTHNLERIVQLSDPDLAPHANITPEQKSTTAEGRSKAHAAPFLSLIIARPPPQLLRDWCVVATLNRILSRIALASEFVEASHF